MNSNDRRSLAWLIWYEKSMIGRRTNTALTMSFATVVGESDIPPSRLRRARRTCTGRRSSRAHTGTYTRTCRKVCRFKWGIGGNVGTHQSEWVFTQRIWIANVPKDTEPTAKRSKKRKCETWRF